VNNWKAKLPAEKPDEGKRHVVFACGRSRGSRLEWAGQLTDDQVKRIWEIVLPPKVPAA
jgi:hypothetical protein